MNSIRITAALGFTLFLAGTIHTAPAPPEKPWGTIKGQVTWEGNIPKGGGETYVVNGSNKGLKNVMVWLINPKGSLPINPSLKTAKEVSISIQAGPPRRFEPHVLALHDKQAIVIKNPTAVADNIHYWGSEEVGDNFFLAARDEKKVSLAASRKPYVVVSDFVASMSCFVRVFDHPYFAVTDADGKFEIKGAPAGKYNIVMWHEGIGWVNSGKNGNPIAIPAGKTVEVNEKAKADE